MRRLHWPDAEGQAVLLGAKVVRAHYDFEATMIMAPRVVC